MRSLPLLATGLIAVGLMTPTTAQAAGETCQGRAATVVGSGVHVRGTEGPDVVVTNGAADVHTLGGDDLVCVTGVVPAGGTTSVQAGDGADVVDASAATGSTYAQLGAGSDTYAGSAHADHVEGGDHGGNNALWTDVEPDTIATGTGADEVFSGSQGPSLGPNADVVSVAGSDAEVSWWGPMTDGARLTGGGGSNLRLEVGGAADADVDARAGTVTQDGVTTLRWTGFDRFVVEEASLDPLGSLSFTGSDRDEVLDARVLGLTRMDIDLGGGADALVIARGDLVGADGSSYAGGEGRDRLALWAGGRLRLDLASGRMASSYGGPLARATLTGFESTFVVASRLDLSGTKGDDDLRFRACRATVRGRAGADRIMQNPYGRTFDGSRLTCQRRSFRLLGGGGDDVLRGSAGSDVLLGGPGRDTISGNAGRDRCSGEKLRSCEIKVR